MPRMIQFFTDDGDRLFACSVCFHQVKATAQYCWYCGASITDGIIENTDQMWNELNNRKELPNGTNT